jgi:hypothetical protein
MTAKKPSSPAGRARPFERAGASRADEITRSFRSREADRAPAPSAELEAERMSTPPMPLIVEWATQERTLEEQLWRSGSELLPAGSTRALPAWQDWQDAPTRFERLRTRPRRRVRVPFARSFRIPAVRGARSTPIWFVASALIFGALMLGSLGLAVLALLRSRRLPRAKR